ncbi:MAG: hypothetical protein AAFO82_01910, partial [Bacteroidota bacterium]
NDYVDQSMYEIEERGSFGRFGCYELIFPVNLNFPDGSSEEIEDYEDLRETIETWKEANTESEERPTLEFPLEVTNEEGELLSIENAEELLSLRMECRRDFARDRRGHRNRCGRCFTFVYPITLAFPDESTKEVESARQMQRALRAWRRDNRGSEERPRIVFPIQVELKADESIVDVADAEALAELRDSCREEN